MTTSHDITAVTSDHLFPVPDRRLPSSSSLSLSSLYDVSIYWDFDNVRIPSWCPATAAAEHIRNKVCKYGRIVEKRLYYDSRKPAESSAPRSDLDLSGFTLVDCPSRNRKETLDKKLIVDVLCFAWERASRGAKACVVLITSDGDYSYALARLRDIGVFTVIIYRPDIVAKVLIDNANVVMSWEYDVLGGPPANQDDDDDDGDGDGDRDGEENDDDEIHESVVSSSKQEDQIESVENKDPQHLGYSNDEFQFSAHTKKKFLVNILGLKNNNEMKEQDSNCKDQQNAIAKEQECATPNKVSQPQKGDDDNDDDDDEEDSKLPSTTTTTLNIEEEDQHNVVVVDDVLGSSQQSKKKMQQSAQQEATVKQPSQQTRGKFALFCSVVLNAQYRNIKQGLSVYSSWADEGFTAANFYQKVGEKDRQSYLDIRTLATKKCFIEWGRRNLSAPGKPVIKVKDRDDIPEGLSSESYLRLTYAGLAVLKPDNSSNDGDWKMIMPKVHGKVLRREITVDDSAASSSSASAINSETPIKAAKSKNTGKVFVGGLAWQTTEDSLRSYFKQFGPIKHVVVMEGRGFGFVFFQNPNDCEIVLKNAGNHVVDDRSVDVKPYNR